MKTLQERFEEKYIPEPTSGCWLWTASTDIKGYGRINCGRKPKLAHRISYELTKGPIPGGLHVLHKCDNPSCVNPNHLYLGTQADNMRDMTEKGHRAVGENHGGAKLTEFQIADIVDDPRLYKEISEEYGIGQGQISHIKSKEGWAHLYMEKGVLK